MLCYIYSYLKSRKQCVNVNNITSTVEEIIPGVPQRSIVGPMSFNIFFNDFLYFILVASAHNLKMAISFQVLLIENPITILKSEIEIAIIMNPVKS